MKVNHPAQRTVKGANSEKVSATNMEKDPKTRGLAGQSEADALAPSRVDISSRGKEASKAKEIAMNTTDVDEAKVAHFQNLIDKGLYKVDAEKVADKLVDEHLGFLGDEE